MLLKLFLQGLNVLIYFFFNFYFFMHRFKSSKDKKDLDYAIAGRSVFKYFPNLVERDVNY